RKARAVSWFVPVKTKNPLNSRQHWRKVYELGVEQKETTLMEAPKDIRWVTPVIVILKRYYCGAPCPSDDDGLAASLKHIRDGVAEVVGVDDGDKERFFVRCEEERVPHRNQVGVQVTVLQGAR